MTSSPRSPVVATSGNRCKYPPSPPCYEVQKSIQDRENLSKMYGNEIDSNQEKVYGRK